MTEQLEARLRRASSARQGDPILLRAADTLKRYREALQRIEEGDVPRPIGKHWRADCKPTKHDRCVHDVWMYEDCGECVSAYIRQALSDS